MRHIEEGDICENGECDHKASLLWTGKGGTLAITRSHMQSKWCDCCATKAQLEFAEEVAARVERLRARLASGCHESHFDDEDEDGQL